MNCSDRLRPTKIKIRIAVKARPDRRHESCGRFAVADKEVRQLHLDQAVSLARLRTDYLGQQAPDALILVNGKYAGPDYVVRDQDTITVIPPVAGG